ncbi:MAG: hypothetical protein U0168_28900 [Nannocystaceae bacterium]
MATPLLPTTLALALASTPVTTPAGLPAPCVANARVDAPRPATKRPPPARPIAVFTVAAGALAFASGASVFASGIEARHAAPRGDTFGEAASRLKTGRTLAIAGGTHAIAGLAALAGGIAWIVRERRRARAATAPR